jgi:hypothetical protein
MTSWSIKGGLLLAGFLPSIALAASPLEYDCDTASGSFSELKQPGIAGKPVAVRGTVQARQLRADGRWMPVAAASVKSDDGDIVMLRITAVEHDKGPLRLQLLTRKNGNNNEQVLASTPIDQAVPFSIVPSANGVAVTLGSERRQVAFAQDKPSATSVSCSTGEFLFTDLRFGE